MEEKKKAKQKQVKVVSSDTLTALVEYDLKRVYVPTDAVADGKVGEDVLAAGEPYGVPWETVALKADAQALADYLRRNNIWTWRDLQRNPGVAQAALQAMYGIDISAVFQLAEAYKEA